MVRFGSIHDRNLIHVLTAGSEPARAAACFRAGLLVLLTVAFWCAFSAHANGDVLIIGDEPGETFTVEAGTIYDHQGDICVAGNGSLQVDGVLNLTGSLIVTNSGSVVVDGGEFHLWGDDTHIYVQDDATIDFQNGALLHYVQSYYAQHVFHCSGNGSAEFRDSHVDCNGAAEAVDVRGTASYEAYNTTFADWTSWYVFDQSTLILEGVDNAGDIVFYDTPTIRLVDTDVIMPWLYFGAGAAVDYTFPAIVDVMDPVTATFDDAEPGISGIGWTVEIQNCTQVYWGIHAAVGSDVTIRDSALSMVLFPFAGTGTATLSGVMQNDSFYDDTTVPVTDRDLRLVDTSVDWWKVDVKESAELLAGDLVFSEMVLSGNAVGHLYDSVCQGQTIHLGAVQDAYLEFTNGQVWSYVDVWDDAVMVLRDTLVDYRLCGLGYQSRNIAHGNSRLYCLNTSFAYEVDPAESEPEAQDAALAMFLDIDGPTAVRVGESVDFEGSAWIEAGPDSPVTFDRYQVLVARDRTPDCLVFSDSGAYGRITGGDQSHVEEMSYTFDGVPGDLTVSFQAWDVDLADEVEILVNGVHVDYAPTTQNNEWGRARQVVIRDALVSDTGPNALTFANTYNPPNTYRWGVRELAIYRDGPARILLSDSGAYGRISGGDQSHTEEVAYSFEGVAGDVAVCYEVWDVDLSDEVEIRVNGAHLAYAETTDNNEWGDARCAVIPDEEVLDSGTNVLTFDNTYNPPNTYGWGVGDVSISQGCRCWKEVAASTVQVDQDLLCTWDTTGMPSGPYRARLVTRVDGDTTAYPTDDYPAETSLQLVDEVVYTVLANGSELTEPYATSVEELDLLEVLLQVDEPSGQAFTYSAFLDDGAVPAPWEVENPDQTFAFDPDTRIFRWTPSVTSSRPEPYALMFAVWDGFLMTTVDVEITVDPIYPPVVDQVLSDGLVMAEPYGDSKKEHLEAFQISIDAHDPDGDPLTYSAFLDGDPAPDPADNPQGKRYTFDPATRIFSWAPALGASDTSPYELTLAVTDNIHAPVTETVELVVEPIHPPVVDQVLSDGAALTEPYRVTKTEHRETFQISIDAHDPDGDPLAYTAYLDGDPAPHPDDNPQGKRYTFDPATRTFSWAPAFTASESSPYELTLAVTDNVLNPVTATVELVVEQIHTPIVDAVTSDGAPLTEPYSVAKLEHLEAFQISIDAHDPDGDPLTYSAFLDGDPAPDPADNPQGKRYTFDPATRTFSWAPALTASETSPYELTFAVTDSILAPVTVTVELVVDPLHPPEVDAVYSDDLPLSEPYGVTKVEQLETFRIAIDAHDPDGDPVQYSAYLSGDLVPDPADNPQGKPYTFDPATRLFEWAPAYTSSDTSPFELQFVLSDGVLAPSFVNVELTVEPLPLPVIAPVTANSVDLDSPYRVVIREMELLEVQFEATSSWGGTPVRDAYFNGDDVPAPEDVEGYPPEYYSFDPATGLFSFIPVPDSASDVPNSLSLVAVTNPVWSSELVEVHIRPSEADFSCPECIPLAGGGAFGKLSAGDETHADEVKYSFDGVTGDVAISYEVWDVDAADEVEILVNGVSLDHALVTPDETWSGTRLVVLPDELVFDTGSNILTFSNTLNPPGEEFWGVREVAIWDGCPECIPLPDSGAYGMISGGDQTHPNEVNYSFLGTSGDFTITFEVWDVDLADEVEILLNGIHVGYTEITPNKQWGGLLQVGISEEFVFEGYINVLTFNNTYNPSYDYKWGVRNVSILEYCTDCIVLPNSGAYGKFTTGDLTHVDEVNYIFEGASGNFTVFYEMWDMDTSDEVEILINGVHAEYAEATDNKSWGGIQVVMLADASVLDDATNSLCFTNTYNPPEDYKWGVRNVSILEDCTTDCITLPNGGAYGKFTTGDLTHVDEVNYTFEGVDGDITVHYEVWDVDIGYEVEILINGVHAAYAEVTDEKAWSQARIIVLDDANVLDDNINYLTFDNIKNPPNTYKWGVGNVWIEQ